MSTADVAHAWSSYVALGDSFTEGLADGQPDGTFRGWADRLAQRLSRGRPDFAYANLAVRGKLLRQIIDEQVPRALDLRPALVTLSGGGNDLIRPGGDPDTLADAFEDAVSRVRATGSGVVIFTGFDTRDTPVLRHVRGKVGTYNSHLRAIADRHSCQVIDLWAMHVLSDPRAWSADRLHLSPEGHRRVTLRTCEVLGLPVEEDWRASWPPAPPQDWMTLRKQDLRWVREHLVPWIGRRLRGESSGDGLEPKRPELEPL